MIGNYRDVADGSQRAGYCYAKIRLRVNIFDLRGNVEMTTMISFHIGIGFGDFEE